MRLLVRATLFLCSLMLLSACGGGGGGGSDSSVPETPTTIAPTNKAPTIGAGNVEAQADSNITLSAQATDSDGTISSYAWVQTSGTSVNIASADQASVSFTTPNADEQEILTFDITVTDDDGVGTTKSITITVNPKFSGFTLSGKVTTANEVFANMPVTVYVGDTAFETQTNELGSYSIDIDNISYDDNDTIVRVVAARATQNSIIKLASYIDDVKTLTALAQQNDGAVDSSLNGRLIVSNLSTAAAVLLEQDNNQSVLTNMLSFNDASVSINDEILMTYAAMIEYVISIIDSPTYQMPSILLDSSFTNIYEYLRNQEQATALYYEIGNDKLELDRFRQDILDNKTLHAKTTLSQNTTLYTTLGAISLYNDQTASLINTTLGLQAGNWSITDDSIEISFDTPYVDENYLSTEYTEEYGDTSVSRELQGYTVYEIFSSAQRNILLIKSKYAYKISGTEEYVTPVIDDVTALHSSFVANNTLDLGDIIAPQKRFAVSFSHPKPSTFIDYQGSEYDALISAMNLEFTSSSTVDISFDAVDEEANFTVKSQSASWTIENGILNISNSKWNFNIALLTVNNPTVSEIFVRTQFTENGVSYYSAGKNYMDVLPANEMIWQPSDIAGIYQYTDELLALSPIETYWYELFEDGTANYFSVQATNDELPTIHEDDIFDSPGLWRVIDGELVIRRYRYNRDIINEYGRCHSDEWDTTLASACILYIERSWKLYTLFTHQNESHALVKQRVVYYYDFIRDQVMTETSPSGSFIGSASSMYTNFIRLDERPVTFPDDYVTVKDRTRSNQLNTTFSNVKKFSTSIK